MLEAVNQSADTVLHRLFGRQILHVHRHSQSCRADILVDETADRAIYVQVKPDEFVIFEAHCPRRFRSLGDIRLDNIALLAPVITSKRNKRDMFFTLAASHWKPAVVSGVIDKDTVKSQRDMLIEPFVKIKFIVR